MIFLMESLASSWMLWAHLQSWRHFGSLSWSRNVGGLIEINNSSALVLWAGLVYGTKGCSVPHVDTLNTRIKNGVKMKRLNEKRLWFS